MAQAKQQFMLALLQINLLFTMMVELTQLEQQLTAYSHMTKIHFLQTMALQKLVIHLQTGNITTLLITLAIM